MPFKRYSFLKNDFQEFHQVTTFKYFWNGKRGLRCKITALGGQNYQNALRL